MHDINRAPERALALAIVLNAAFLLVELGVGIWSNSLALLSDAGHMVSDVAALSVAYVAHRVARKRPGRGYTFGLRRLPVLGGFINGMTLVAVVVLVVHEAIDRLRDPQPVIGLAVLIAGAVGLVINATSAYYLHRHAGRSVNIRAAMVHLIADGLGSVTAMVSAVVILTTRWYLIDPLMSLAIALLIVAASWPILREAVRILLQRAPMHIDMAALRELVMEQPDVIGVSDLHLWELDSGDCVLSAIVVLSKDDDLRAVSDRSDRIKDLLRERFHIEHATIEWRTADARIDLCACPGHEHPQVAGSHCG